MNQYFNSSPKIRLEMALESLKNGQGVLVLDDEDRENEGDLIYSTDHLTPEQMALMIRECSGIVCLCLTDEKVEQLELPMMVEADENKTQFQTAFTLSIEAAKGVTTGVSAADRVTTIKAAAAIDAQPQDINSPGHVFPLRARQDGVLERQGHTEATVDLMRLAGLSPSGVLCELTNADGTMARTPEVIAFGEKHNIPVVTIQDIIAHRETELPKAS